MSGSSPEHRPKHRKRMAKSGTGRDEITVILPPEPPELNPEAARALLRILLKAYEKQFGHEFSPAAED